MYASRNSRTNKILACALTLTGLGCSNQHLDSSSSTRQKLLEVTRSYSSPSILIGYEGLNVRANPSIYQTPVELTKETLRRELSVEQNLQRRDSMGFALNLADICEQSKLPYQLSRIISDNPNNPYKGMSPQVEEDRKIVAFPVLVYCLPDVNLDKIEGVQQWHSSVLSKEYGQSIKSRSFIYGDKGFNEIGVEKKK